MSARRQVMTRYIYHARIAALAGLVVVAALAVSAGSASATLACPPGTTNPAYCTSKPPTAVTKPATKIGETSATLNGVVNSFGANAEYYFEYGQTRLLGKRTPTRELAALSGCAPGVTNPLYCLCPPGTANPAYCTIPRASNVSAVVTGLAFNTVYYFRLVARNANGTAFGFQRTFKTLNVLPIRSVFAPASVAHSTSRHTNHFKVTVHLRRAARITISILLKRILVDKINEGIVTGTIVQTFVAPGTIGKYSIQVVARATNTKQTVTQPIKVT
jgi:hypothetical protein